MLVFWIEQWRTGVLRHLAVLWDEIEDRDPNLKGVVAKRKRAASRCPWEIITEDKSEEAAAHRDFLEDFYSRLTATSVLEQDARGGVPLLLRQMMDAVGRRYSVHEIVWRPGRDGSLTAELIHAPLWFFEGRNGKLRYLPSDFALDGIEMQERDWLVTVGDGLMMASAIAYIGKDLAYKDWLNYSERFGQPIVDAATDATQGTAEWESLREALNNLIADGFILRNRAAAITLLESKGAGSQPQPGLVEYADRAIAALWRGGDLSTMSAGTGQGQGASLQGNESEDLTADDCELLSEALNQRLDLQALRWKFGRDVKPMAWFRVQPATRRGFYESVAVDRFLAEHGFPLAVADVAERYGRTVPETDEPLLTVPGTVPADATLPDQGQPSGTGTPQDGNPDDSAPTATGRMMRESDLDEFARQGRQNGDRAILANVAAAQTQALRDAFARDLQPLAERLRAILRIEDPDLFASKLQALRDEAPGLLRDLGADPEAARELEVLLSKAMLDGLAGRPRRL